MSILRSLFEESLEYLFKHYFLFPALEDTRSSTGGFVVLLICCFVLFCFVRGGGVPAFPFPREAEDNLRCHSSVFIKTETKTEQNKQRQSLHQAWNSPDSHQIGYAGWQRWGAACLLLPSARSRAPTQVLSIKASTRWQSLYLLL